MRIEDSGESSRSRPRPQGARDPAARWTPPLPRRAGRRMASLRARIESVRCLGSRQGVDARAAAESPSTERTLSSRVCSGRSRRSSSLEVERRRTGRPPRRARRVARRPPRGCPRRGPRGGSPSHACDSRCGPGGPRPALDLGVSRWRRPRGVPNASTVRSAVATRRRMAAAAPRTRLARASAIQEREEGERVARELGRELVYGERSAVSSSISRAPERPIDGRESPPPPG